MLYLDHAATSPLDGTIAQLYTQLNQTQFANSESSYDLGQVIHQQLEKSRSILADFFGVRKQDILFTSGASESNSMALKGIALALKEKGNHIITTKIEHRSILNACSQLEQIFGFDVTYLDVDQNGMIDLDTLKQALTDKTVLVSIMHVNNEIGAINPIETIGKIIKQHSKAIFHSDIVQSVGKYPIDFNYLDCASISAHKLGGLKGSGLLIKKHHIPLLPLINGGQQEFGLRGGTIDANRCILFAKTIKQAAERYAQSKTEVHQLKKLFIKQLEQFDGVNVHCKEPASDYILSFSWQGYSSEMIFNVLQAKQIYVSYRSTCHSKEKQPSHVLSSIGCSQSEMESVIRISWDYSLNQAMIDQFLSALKGVIQYGKNQRR